MQRSPEPAGALPSSHTPRQGLGCEELATSKEQGSVLTLRENKPARGNPNGVFRAKYAWVPSGHTVRTLHEDSVEGQGCQLTSDQELPVPLPPSIYDSRFCQHTRLMGLTLCK